jgi:heme/copper-type cytochrome/quinol oxidase subunit 2
MKRLVFISNWFYQFSLSLWVGGMFLLGILVEIMVRINLKDQPQVASTIMNKVMDVFNIHIIYTCITFMVLAEIIKFLVAKYSSVGYKPQVVTKRKYTREVCLVVMIVLALYIGSVLRPEMHAMDKLKKANPADQKLQIQFDRYHSQLTWFYTVNMILGLTLFYINGKEMARFSTRSGASVQ